MGWTVIATQVRFEVPLKSADVIRGISHHIGANRQPSLPIMFRYREPSAIPASKMPFVQAGVDIYTVQKLGRWKTISMVMRYAHHHPESLRAGIEILDLPAGVSKVLAQSASYPVSGSRSASAVSA